MAFVKFPTPRVVSRGTVSKPHALPKPAPKPLLPRTGRKGPEGNT